MRYSQTDIDDDLFARPPRSVMRQAPPIERTASRQCRYCNLLYKVGIDYDGPPFCDGCRADLKATKANVWRDLASVLAQMDAAIADLEWSIPAYRPLWDKIQDARAKVDAGEATEEQFKERWEIRRAEGGSWRVLIELIEERDRALARLGAERARLERALEAIDGSQ